PLRCAPWRRPALPPREGARRQGLRSSPLPRLPVRAGHQGPHRPLWDRVLPAAGPPSVEGRTLDRLAGGVSAAADPLRPGLRAVLRLRHAGLRAAGLQPASRYRRGARTVTLIEVPECPLSGDDLRVGCP